MKAAAVWAGCALWLATAALAQSPVTVKVGTESPGYLIPDDFAGLSFETGSELKNKNHVDGYLFSATNRALVTLFQNIGLRNLRVGGGTVDGTNAAIPTEEGIDNLFAFGRAAGDLRIIYSFRLLNGSSAEAAAAAKYIWERSRSQVAEFSIGNEPDWKSFHYPPAGTGSDPAITDYASYLARWREFAAAITNVAPGAKFAGPDTGEYSDATYFDGKSWTEHFALDEEPSPLVTLILQHYYAGGGPGKTRGPQAISNMLSAEWAAKKYPGLYEHNLQPVQMMGMSYRLTEANDYLRGVADASNAYASALWALDFLHWWAAHGCAGVNFHNKSWLLTDTIYLGASGKCEANPKAYGIKAFDLGSHGRVKTATIETNGVNLTAYVVDATSNLFVTIINKENGAGARDAAVTVVPYGIRSANVMGMFLTAPNGNIAATNGLTLGGAPLANDASWRGQWTSLGMFTNGQFAVKVPAASAAVVRIVPAVTAGKTRE